ncbi:hypothetical protein [Blastococcus deserti]|uniref:Uncharacterized protein n=1 Tax=Blastococcus deserti TaxID=2259033 RepID=A0ABW4X6Z3_9ACTN
MPELPEPETTIHARTIAADPIPEKKPKKGRKPTSWRPLRQHASGTPLLWSSGLITGLALVPLVLDQITGELFLRASGAARSAAPPWPTHGQPWLWPSWMAAVMFLIGVAVLVVGMSGLKVPDAAVLVVALATAAGAARAVWSTFTVINAHLWELVPVCAICVLAFLLAATAAARWRQGGGGLTRGAIGVAIGAWVAVTALLLGGTAIVQNIEKSATSSTATAQLGTPWLMSLRAANAPTADDLRGHWVARIAAGQVTDETSAAAYAGWHRDLTFRFPVVLVRADDLSLPDMDDSWWLSLAGQPFDTPDAALAWCTAAGVAPTECAPLEVKQ